MVTLGAKTTHENGRKRSANGDLSNAVELFKNAAIACRIAAGRTKAIADERLEELTEHKQFTKMRDKWIERAMHLTKPRITKRPPVKEGGSKRPASGRYCDVKKSFATACRRAGIKDFHFHDLRHTFASQLVMNGVDITTVSKLLGHSTLTMTLRYAHLAPNHLKNAVDVLSRLNSLHDNLYDIGEKKA